MNHATTLGYHFTFYEVLQFEGTSEIFSKFMKTLNYFKLRYSGFPIECQSEEQKQNYCDQLNEANDYSGDFKLRLDNVEKIESKRTYYKLAMNGTLGKVIKLF